MLTNLDKCAYKANKNVQKRAKCTKEVNNKPRVVRLVFLGFLRTNKVRNCNSSVVIMRWLGA